MKTYSVCPDALAARSRALIKKHFPLHQKLGVTIDHLFVSTDGDGSALRLGGYPCQAIIRKTSVKERAAGRADAEMVICHANWLELTEAQQTALLHHELYHLVLKLDGKGKPTVDAAGRPVIKIRLHDHQFGWFDEVARLYGDNSLEVRQARRLQAAPAGQLYLDFNKPAKHAEDATLKQPLGADPAKIEQFRQPAKAAGAS